MNARQTIACSAILAALAGSAPGQVEPGKPTPVPAGGRVDLEFPGGTVQQYVDLVQEKSDNGGISVIVTPEAADLRLGKVKLTGVAAQTAFEVLPAVTGKVSLDAVGPGPSVFVIRAPHSVQYQFGAPQEKSVRVFAIRDLLHPKGVYSAEEVLSAIEAAIDLVATIDPPSTSIKLHPDTGLLLVSGTEREVNMVQHVVEELRKGSSSASSGPAVMELRDEITMLHKEIELLKQRLSESQKKQQPPEKQTN